MSEQILIEIIELGLKLEKKAVGTYKHFLSSSLQEPLEAFWHQMLAEESEHVGFWTDLLDLSRYDVLPQVFEDPYLVLDELMSIDAKTDGLIESFDASPTISNMFLLAYRMEFLFLHPAFLTLFRFARTARWKNSAVDEYTAHLNRFLQGLKEHAEDIPELELLSETLERLWRDNVKLLQYSTTDLLTGILNRKGLFDSIHMMASLSRRSGSHVALIMIDIDLFKNVNDSHGHQKGDRVLRDVTQIIARTVRSSDVIGRYGGDEILVFVPSAQQKTLPEFAGKIVAAVEGETKNRLPVTISMGIASGIITGNVDEEIDRLIRDADTCLYQAKHTGRNKFVISA